MERTKKEQKSENRNEKNEKRGRGRPPQRTEHRDCIQEMTLD